MRVEISDFVSFLRASTAALITSERFTLALPETISSRIMSSISFRLSSKSETLTGLALLTKRDFSGAFTGLSVPAVPPFMKAVSSRGGALARFLTESPLLPMPQSLAVLYHSAFQKLSWILPMHPCALYGHIHVISQDAFQGNPSALLRPDWLH